MNQSRLRINIYAEEKCKNVLQSHTLRTMLIL